MQFASYRAAAAFARRYAQRLNASAKIRRVGSYWTVAPLGGSDVIYDPEIDALQRAEGRARYLDEIAETVSYAGATSGRTGLPKL